MTTTDAIVSRPLRILAIHRYFWPDSAPYGVLLRSIVRRWSEDGHDVETLSTQPSYRTAGKQTLCKSVEFDHGVRIRRVRLMREDSRGAFVRVLNIAAWVLTLFVYILKRGRFDLILIGTTPPVVAAAAAGLAASISGARLLYHCMDIHPEIGRISGEFANPFIFRFLQRLDSRTCRKAFRVVVLSTDMERAIVNRPGKPADNIRVINNFHIADQDSPTSSQTIEVFSGRNRLKILFGGNIGRFQGLHTVVDGLRLLQERDDWEMVFMGDGIAVSTLQQQAGSLLGDRIKFVAHQSTPVVKQAIRNADICLVSLSPGISRYAYPSKTMTYLAEGRPILACVEEDSDLAQLVIRENLGIVVPPCDPIPLAAAIGTLADRPERCVELQRQASRVGPRLFDERETLGAWSKLAAQISPRVC